jgi:glycerol-3-phosphate dehydrogenase (NAD(P)+)
MTETVLILGDGQMALVAADALHERGVRVRIWGPFAEHVDALRTNRLSPRLTQFTLHESIEVTADDAAAFEDVTLIINAIPAQYVRSVWQRLLSHVPPRVPVVSVTKGIENETLMRPTEVIAELRQDIEAPAICVLSGPTIAAELARRLPAAMVAASDDEALAARVQDIFNVPWLRIYRHDDPLGVEIAGATKNVIALAAGMLDGLGGGDNAKSALLARGLAEIARLGVAMGAKLDTFFGVAGVGDLATTCFSPSGRNRSCGERLGCGESLDAILHESKSIVEGVPTTRSVMMLAQRYDIEMPICEAVHRILFDGLAPAEAIRQLMSRDFKAERVG